MRSGPLLSLSTAAVMILVLVRCSSPPEPTSRPASPAPAQSPADASSASGGDASPGLVEEKPAEPAPPSAADPAAESQAQTGAAPVTSPPMAPSAGTPPTATADAPAPSVADPGGVVKVAATREGLTEVGAAKCRPCHKLQFDSWAGTAHARRDPPLECEGCHGPGSEYKDLAVMNDPEKAKAAGVVLPDAAFCQRCHRTWSDDMLTKAHLHKSKPS